MATLNPLNLANEGEKVLVILLSLVAICVLWVYRRRVIFVLTGDDRIHVNLFDVFWYGCCKCGNICDGNWTICLSYLCCWTTCPTSCYCMGIGCNERWRGKNLKKELARKLGVLPKTVVFRNVVVGDVPFDSTYGDFYVTFECGQNPSMSSSLAENHNPKLIHIPESFSLRVRDSHLESPVIITVMELNTLGHDNVCRLSLPMKKYFPKLRDGKILRTRFQMEEIETITDLGAWRKWMPWAKGDAQASLSPWIMLEIGLEEDIQDERYVRYMTTNTDTACLEPVPEPQRLKDFKKSFHLIDKNGIEVPEPEDMSEQRHRAEAGRRLVQCCAFSIIILAYVFLAVFRTFVWGCWREYRLIAVAEGQNYTGHYPLPGRMARQYRKKLQFLDDDDVYAVCATPPRDQHGDPYRPKVFERLTHQYFSWLGKFCPLPICYETECDWHGKFAKYPIMSILIVVGVIIMLCLIFNFPENPYKYHKGAMLIGGDEDHEDEEQARNRRTSAASSSQDHEERQGLLGGWGTQR